MSEVAQQDTPVDLAPDIYLENYQPNMKMFDTSINSGLTGMSVEMKAFSPVSILRSPKVRQDDVV